MIITTSNNNCGDPANKTGVWLEDLAAPYYILKDGGEFITIASPQGGQIPVDVNSKSQKARTKETIRFLADKQALYHSSHALPLKEIKAEDYDLVFLSGGHCAMYDFLDDDHLKQILDVFYLQNKPIGLVGNAVVALIPLSSENFRPLVEGKHLTAFSNAEEHAADLNEAPPFLLESKLVSLGALYSKERNFLSHVVVDGNIITGQNPASAVQTAEQVLALARREQEILIF